jgi:hypothetical protein
MIYCQYINFIYSSTDRKQAVFPIFVVFLLDGESRVHLDPSSLWLLSFLAELGTIRFNELGHLSHDALTTQKRVIGLPVLIGKLQT